MSSRRWTFNWLFRRSSAAAELLLARQGLEPRGELRGVLVAVPGLVGLFFDLGAKVGVIAADALELAVQPLAQLAVIGVGQRREGPDHAVAGDRVGRGQARVRRFGQRRPGLLGQVRAIEQSLQVAHLPAVVQVDRHRQEVLLLLVADERRLEPENRLGEMQRLALARPSARIPAAA